MKPAPFTYHRPSSVDAAVRLLASLGESAKVIAGGQSLLPIMNMRLAEPEHLVDVTGVPELRAHSVDARAASYGAAVTHQMVEDGLVADVTLGLLPYAATGIGYRAIRTRGTLGGSLAHSDSSAEWPTVMSALDALVVVRSVRGARRVPVRELLLGFFATSLEPDELIVAVEVPRLASRWGLRKTARKPGEFAESLAVVLDRPDGAEVWLGAARDVPVRLAGAERVLAASPQAGPGDLTSVIAADLGDTSAYALNLHAVTVHRAVEAMRREESHV